MNSHADLQATILLQTRNSGRRARVRDRRVIGAANETSERQRLFGIQSDAHHAVSHPLGVKAEQRERSLSLALRAVTVESDGRLSAVLYGHVERPILGAAHLVRSVLNAAHKVRTCNDELHFFLLPGTCLVPLLFRGFTGRTSRRCCLWVRLFLVHLSLR